MTRGRTWRLGQRWGVLLFCVSAITAFAQLQDERVVRAAYVFNLAKNIEWPESQNELLIGYFGSSETGMFLQRMLEGRIVASKPLRLILLPTETDLENCGMVYVADPADKRIRSVLQMVANRNIVTVGESESFLQAGGMIALLKVHDQVQMQVNLEAVQRAGVKIEARLLNPVAKAPVPGSQHAARRVVQRQEPQYPAIAAKMALHGAVRIRVVVAPNGTVSHAECIGGHPVLADSALAAVRAWRFEANSRESTETVEFDF